MLMREKERRERERKREWVSVRDRERVQREEEINVEKFGRYENSNSKWRYYRLLPFSE